jgi:hypothetical protein
VTLAPKGLLIEESRTNLLTFSEQFDNAAWTSVNSNVVANDTISPDGQLTADLLESNSASSNSKRRQQSITTTASINYTFSCFLKLANASIPFAGISLSSTADAASYVTARWDLSNGTNTLGTASAGFTFTGQSITPVGNGWYRCSVTGIIGSNTDMVVVIFGTISGTTIGSGVRGAQSYTVAIGDDVCYIWGAQLESGSFSTSYIPTTTATATRAADVAVMTGANFSNWYNAANGTLFSEYINYTTVTGSLFSFDDNTINNRILTLTSGGTTAAVRVVAGGVNQVSADIATVPVGTVGKIAFAYKLNDFAASVNASTVVTDTSGTVPAGQIIARIGSNVATAAFLNGHIRRLAFFPRRLADAELQGVTA